MFYENANKVFNLHKKLPVWSNHMGRGKYRSGFDIYTHQGFPADVNE